MSRRSSAKNRIKTQRGICFLFFTRKKYRHFYSTSQFSCIFSIVFIQLGENRGNPLRGLTFPFDLSSFENPSKIFAFFFCTKPWINMKDHCRFLCLFPVISLFFTPAVHRVLQGKRWEADAFHLIRIKGQESWPKDFIIRKIPFLEVPTWRSSKMKDFDLLDCPTFSPSRLNPGEKPNKSPLDCCKVQEWDCRCFSEPLTGGLFSQLDSMTRRPYQILWNFLSVNCQEIVNHFRSTAVVVGTSFDGGCSDDAARWLACRCALFHFSSTLW